MPSNLWPCDSKKFFLEDSSYSGPSTEPNNTAANQIMFLVISLLMAHYAFMPYSFKKASGHLLEKEFYFGIHFDLGFDSS